METANWARELPRESLVRYPVPFLVALGRTPHVGESFFGPSLVGLPPLTRLPEIPLRSFFLFFFFRPPVRPTVTPCRVARFFFMRNAKRYSSCWVNPGSERFGADSLFDNECAWSLFFLRGVCRLTQPLLARLQVLTRRLFPVSAKNQLSSAMLGSFPERNGFSACFPFEERWVCLISPAVHARVIDGSRKFGSKIPSISLQKSDFVIWPNHGDDSSCFFGAFVWATMP